MQYKAHFRWNHDTLSISDFSGLPEETEACASVTACFLQVCYSSCLIKQIPLSMDMGFMRSCM